eukprot:5974571-Amphidinium_carterae.3
MRYGEVVKACLDLAATRRGCGLSHPLANTLHLSPLVVQEDWHKALRSDYDNIHHMWLEFNGTQYHTGTRNLRI